MIKVSNSFECIVKTIQSHQNDITTFKQKYDNTSLSLVFCLLLLLLLLFFCLLELLTMMTIGSVLRQNYRTDASITPPLSKVPPLSIEQIS